MKICVTCGAQLEDNSVFCTVCGSQQTQQPAVQPVYSQPVYEQPVYEQPVYEQPVYGQQPAPVDGGTKAKTIVGFVLSMVATVMEFISFCLGITAMDTYSYSDAEELSSAAIGFGITFLAAAIVGIIMSFKGKGGMSIVGRVFGFVAIGLFFFAFLFAIVAIA